MTRLTVAALLGLLVLSTLNASAASLDVDAGVLQAWVLDADVDLPEEPRSHCVVFDRGDIPWDWTSEHTVGKDGITVTKPANSHDDWTWSFTDEPLQILSVTIYANGAEMEASTSPGLLDHPTGSNLQWAAFCYHADPLDADTLDADTLGSSTADLCDGYEDAPFCRGPSDPDR